MIKYRIDYWSELENSWVSEKKENRTKAEYTNKIDAVSRFQKSSKRRNKVRLVEIKETVYTEHRS